MLLDGHEERWDYKDDRNTLLGRVNNVEGDQRCLLSAGGVSLFLDELDEFEARVEEAVDAVGETGLFGARETGGWCSSHAPACFFRSRSASCTVCAR